MGHHTAAPAVLLLALVLAPAWLEAGTRIESQGTLVTAELDQAPVPEVVSAMRRATGVELVLPASTEGKSVTFSLERVPIEQFVRRLLQALDLGGFALVYESSGTVTRLIVVDRGRPTPPGGRPPTAAVPTAPTGPTYVPPATPPVYIPPTTPPVYIPPREPPVYIPPTTPPVYVPPSTPPVYIPPSGPPRQVGQ
jgi:hypothetical protein